MHDNPVVQTGAGHGDISVREVAKMKCRNFDIPTVNLHLRIYLHIKTDEGCKDTSVAELTYHMIQMVGLLVRKYLHHGDVPHI